MALNRATIASDPLFDARVEKVYRPPKFVRFFQVPARSMEQVACALYFIMIFHHYCKFVIVFAIV